MPDLLYGICHKSDKCAARKSCDAAFNSFVGAYGRAEFVFSQHFPESKGKSVGEPDRNEQESNQSRSALRNAMQFDKKTGEASNIEKPRNGICKPLEGCFFLQQIFDNQKEQKYMERSKEDRPRRFFSEKNQRQKRCQQQYAQRRYFRLPCCNEFFQFPGAHEREKYNDQRKDRAQSRNQHDRQQKGNQRQCCKEA